MDKGYWSPELFRGYQVMTSVSEMGFGGPGKRWGGLMGQGERAHQPTKGLSAPPTPSHVTRRGGGATPRKLAPQAGGGGCPRGGAPTSPGYVRGGEGGAQPLRGLVWPLPLAHKAPQRLTGPPKHLSVTLVVTRYSQNNSKVYRSSPPDHSEVPHHVRDLIRDSEQPSVTTYYFP